MVAFQGFCLLELGCKGRCVTRGKVNDVDVVPDTSAIWGVIVSAKDIQVRQVTTCNSLNIWHQVIWDSLWVLTNQPRFVSSNWVEISETDC